MKFVLFLCAFKAVIYGFPLPRSREKEKEEKKASFHFLSLTCNLNNEDITTQSDRSLPLTSQAAKPNRTSPKKKLIGNFDLFCLSACVYYYIHYAPFSLSLSFFRSIRSAISLFLISFHLLYNTITNWLVVYWRSPS